MCVSHTHASGHSSSSWRTPLCYLFSFRLFTSTSVIPPPRLPPLHTQICANTQTQTHTPSLAAGFCPHSPLHTGLWAKGQLMAQCVLREARTAHTHIIWHARSTCVCTVCPAMAPYLSPLPLWPSSTRHTIWGGSQREREDKRRNEQIREVLAHKI